MQQELSGQCRWLEESFITPPGAWHVDMDLVSSRTAQSQWLQLFLAMQMYNRSDTKYVTGPELKIATAGS